MGLSVFGLMFAAIVLPDAATSVEKTAAKELQDAIRRMTGRTERIVSECAALDDRYYFVGATRAAAEIASGICVKMKYSFPRTNGGLFLPGIRFAVPSTPWTYISRRYAASGGGHRRSPAIRSMQ